LPSVGNNPVVRRMGPSLGRSCAATLAHEGARSAKISGIRAPRDHRPRGACVRVGGTVHGRDHGATGIRAGRTCSSFATRGPKGGPGQFAPRCSLADPLGRLVSGRALAKTPSELLTTAAFLRRAPTAWSWGHVAPEGVPSADRYSALVARRRPRSRSTRKEAPLAAETSPTRKLEDPGARLEGSRRRTTRAPACLAKVREGSCRCASLGAVW